ncbi:MAG: formylglycine-generating enzyme family protein [Pseudomonadota bacterium]
MKSCCAPARDAGAVQSPASQGQHALVPDKNAPAVVKIPAGQALVGTNRPHLPEDGEGPLHKKRVAAFVMETTTVTNARFAAFVDATGYVTDAERLGDSLVFAGLLPVDFPPTRAVAQAQWWRVVEGACWYKPFGPDGDGPEPDHPVVHVSWNDALAFATWAGGRLPKEAEWEHAARGGLGDVPFPWGEAEPDDADYQPCNIWQGRFPDRDIGLDGYKGTAPAMSFGPNGYGLYNMVGNVWEFTSEVFKVRSLKKSVVALHAGKTGFKLCKGGSFLCHASYCYRYRIAARNSTSADSSTSHTGFRMVYDAHRNG